MTGDHARGARTSSARVDAFDAHRRGASGACSLAVIAVGLIPNGRRRPRLPTPTPSTIVLIPDTQNYTYSNRTAFLNQQMDWIVSSKDQLNTKFVAHLGDLVSEYDSTSQWPIISDAMKRIDDAGIPNSVIPGNHDFDNTTRAFAQYNTYFPVSRYSQAAWNSASVKYAGYLGQNQFGTDAADRQNMDSYTLLSAGGRDFLILNLEFEAPTYALNWADKVLAAHPGPHRDHGHTQLPRSRRLSAHDRRRAREARHRPGCGRTSCRRTARSAWC